MPKLVCSVVLIYCSVLVACLEANGQQLLVHNSELFRAVMKADLVTTQRLLNSGVDIDSKDENGGNTALILAVSFLDDDRATCDLVRLLLQYHPDVNIQTAAGDTVSRAM